jgi:hypothetical protein
MKEVERVLRAVLADVLEQRVALEAAVEKIYFGPAVREALFVGSLRHHPRLKSRRGMHRCPVVRSRPRQRLGFGRSTSKRDCGCPEDQIKQEPDDFPFFLDERAAPCDSPDRERIR